MTKTWLCLDMHFLAWRSFHTTGRLQYGDVATGVLYGVFRDLVNFTDLHATPHVMFAFDRRPYKRCDLLKSYKANRPFDPDLGQVFDMVRQQIKLLRLKYLKELGYRNVFSQAGYEADDVIASFVQNLPAKDKAIIVASDHDLLQLLDHRTVVWNPNSRRPTTVESFHKEYGIGPNYWPRVKAMAGCASDNIKGIQGVGEKLACKYIANSMNMLGKVAMKIEGSEDLILKNYDLVKLPFPGCIEFVPKKDRVSKQAWKNLLGKLGMKSLLDRYPAGA